MNKDNNSAYNKLIELSGNKVPCSRMHFDNCVLWINQRFGYNARLDRLCDNLICILDMALMKFLKTQKDYMKPIK